ncbi:hypothetical protein [Halorubrum tebenquichense]|uniref:hypothetical protein n=1 Tax=Halorubrum tebenquichense TaxID=119434 RepID=UPI0019D333ED|nr:hypothetical protein [Halorubrum tebenquichense]
MALGQNVTVDELRGQIMDTVSSEWQYFDAPPTWVLTSNRDFSIEMLNRLDSDERRRDQPDWASIFPNETTHRNSIRVQYRGVPFEQKDVFQLDEFRATIVIPARDPDPTAGEPERYLTPFEKRISEIMSGDHLDGYWQGLDVRVE